MTVENEMNRLDADLMVDMKKLETFTDDVINDGKKAELLVHDVSEIDEDWKKTLASTSYITSEFPTLIDALHKSEKIASDCKSLSSSGNLVSDAVTLFKDGDVERVEDILTDIEEVYQNRQKYMHSILTIERWTKNVEHIVKQAMEFCHKHDKKAAEKAKRAEESFAKRWKCMKSKFSHNKLHHGGKGKDESESESSTTSDDAVKTVTVVVKHVSMKAESEKMVSSFDEDAKSLVTDGEDITKFVERNKTTIEAFSTDVTTMQTDWKASLKAIANVQSIIPLVNEALGEVKAIANLVKDAFDAAALNPTAIISLIEDGKQAFDDVKAIYEIAEKIKAVLEAVDILNAFLVATTDLVSKGRTLVISYRSLTGEKGGTKKLTTSSPSKKAEKGGTKKLTTSSPSKKEEKGGTHHHHHHHQK